MKTISLISQKGGGGKTTVAYSLAVAAEKAGYPATVIDLDPHGNAISWAADRKNHWEGRAEAQVPIVEDSIPARLAEKIKKAEADGSEYVFVDTPASLGEYSMAAAKSADLIILPLKPRRHDINAFEPNLNLLKITGVKPAFAFLNECPPQGIRHLEAADYIREKFGFPVASLYFCKREAFADASILGLSAQEYEPKGKAAKEIVQFFDFVHQMLNQLESEDQNGTTQLDRLCAQ